MEKVVRHYIEKFFNRNSTGLNRFEVKASVIDSRNPLMIEEEKSLIGFRFFDVEEVIYDRNALNHMETEKNYSGMYYFGERITCNDLVLASDGDIIKRMQFDYLNRLGIGEAIFCEKTGEIIYPIIFEDRTIDEVKMDEIMRNARIIFVNQREFINRIVELLEVHNNIVSVIVSEIYYPIADVLTFDEVDDVCAIIRTYDLYVDEYKVLSSSAIVNDDRMELENKDTYIRLSDALDTVGLLYQEFPYLRCAMNKFMVELWDNNKEMLMGNVKNKCRKKYKA